jgi:hypothetical protein
MMMIRMIMATTNKNAVTDAVIYGTHQSDTTVGQIF